MNSLSDVRTIIHNRFCDRVDVPNSIVYLNWMPILERYMVRCGSKNGYLKVMWLKEIGLCAQDVITILGSIINKIERTYMTIQQPQESSL